MPGGGGTRTSGREMRERVFEYVVAFRDEHGMSPTVREICDGLGCFPSTVHHHLVRLRRAGLVEWDARAARSLRVVER